MTTIGYFFKGLPGFFTGLSRTNSSFLKSTNQTTVSVFIFNLEPTHLILPITPSFESYVSTGDVQKRDVPSGRKNGVEVTVYG